MKLTITKIGNVYKHNSESLHNDFEKPRSRLDRRIEIIVPLFQLITFHLLLSTVIIMSSCFDQISSHCFSRTYDADIELSLS